MYAPLLSSQNSVLGLVSYIYAVPNSVIGYVSHMQLVPNRLIYVYNSKPKIHAPVGITCCLLKFNSEFLNSSKFAPLLISQNSVLSLVSHMYVDQI
jgi:hypothetical protein